MTEFDFEELDKAVNSLMKDAEPTPPTPAPTSSETEPVTELPAVSPAAPEAEVSPPITAAPTPKPTGRFMDVVHPSSDMRTPASINAKAPTSPMPVSPQASEISFEEPATLVEEAPAPADLPPTPIASPFLPDAQVEKRPLGGIGGNLSSTTSLDEAIAAELSATPGMTPADTTESVAIEAPAVQPEESQNDTEPSPATNEAAITGLPEELSNDLVVIESGEAEPITGGESEEAVETETPSAPADTQAETSAPQAMLSQSSIPQQYKEEESSEVEMHTPIYDDQTTTHPLTQPVKKKSAAKLFIIAGILVLLGIGGAVGLYFLQFNR